MAFNIDTFRARGLVEGGARPCLFQVNVTFPTSTPGNVNTTGGMFLASAAQLPASIIEEVRVPYFGRFIKLEGNRTFQDWTITVLNDEDFALRNAFEDWHNRMNYLVSNILDSQFANQGYKQDIHVAQYAKDGPDGESGQIRNYRMVGAWPITLSPINLDWGDVNRVEQFEVTFAYDYWTPAGTTNTMHAF